MSRTAMQGVPEIPNRPEEPELPTEAPQKPEIPEVPQQPGTPEVPQNPEIPEIPQEPELPEEAVHIVDARGLSCPLPLLKAKQALNQVSVGSRVSVLATDPGSVKDFATFAELSGQVLVESRKENDTYCYTLQKSH